MVSRKPATGGKIWPVNPVGQVIRKVSIGGGHPLSKVERCKEEHRLGISRTIGVPQLRQIRIYRSQRRIKLLAAIDAPESV